MEVGEVGGRGSLKQNGTFIAYQEIRENQVRKYKQRGR